MEPKEEDNSAIASHSCRRGLQSHATNRDAEPEVCHCESVEFGWPVSDNVAKILSRIPFCKSHVDQSVNFSEKIIAAELCERVSEWEAQGRQSVDQQGSPNKP